MTRVIEVFIPYEKLHFVETEHMFNYVLEECGIECYGTLSCTPKGTIEVSDNYEHHGINVRQILEDQNE